MSESAKKKCTKYLSIMYMNKFEACTHINHSFVVFCYCFVHFHLPIRNVQITLMASDICNVIFAVAFFFFFDCHSAQMDSKSFGCVVVYDIELV